MEKPADQSHLHARGPNYERNQDRKHREKRAKERRRAMDSTAAVKPETEPVPTVAVPAALEPEPDPEPQPLATPDHQAPQESPAASGSVLAQKTAGPSPAPEPASLPLMFGWQDCIIHVNDQMLHGYPEDRVHRVGGGDFRGLVSETRLECGPFVNPTISFRCWISGCQDHPTIISSEIYLESFLGMAEIEIVKTSDLEQLATLFPDQNTNVAGLRKPSLPETYFQVFDDFDASMNQDNLSSAEQIRAATDEILRVSFAVAAEDASLAINQTFFDEAYLYPKRMVAIGQSVRDTFEKASPILRVTISTPIRRPKANEPLDEELTYWSRIQMEASEMDPFREILRNTRFGADDLTFDNVNSNVTLPPKPLPAVNSFSSRAHRTVSLIYGAVEENKLNEKLATKLWNTCASAIACPDPKSKWNPTPHDMDEHGIRADGTYTGYYVFVNQADIRGLLPQIGQEVEMYLNVLHARRPMPAASSLSNSEICRTSELIIDNFKKAEQKGKDMQDALEKRLECLKKVENPRLDEITEIEAKLKIVADQTRQTNAAQFLSTLVLRVDAKTRAEHPEWSPALCRSHVASSLADELQRKDAEDDESWTRRLHICVKKHGLFMPKQVDYASECVFQATRLPLPLGVAADIAMFYVRTPLQHNWTPGFRPPPVLLKVPHTEVVGPLQSFLRRVFTDRELVKNAIDVKIKYRPSDTTARVECAAITALNGLTVGTAANAWWNYVVNFRRFDSQYERNLLEAFPALQKRLDQGVYEGEQREAILSLRKTKAGRVILMGCPGSGKTTLAVNICDAVVAEPPGKGWTDEESTAENDIPMPRNGRVAWTAPSNLLIKDAVERIKIACKGKTIAHVFNYQSELANLLQTEPSIPEEEWEDLKQLSGANRQMARHYHVFLKNRRDTTSPSAFADSLSELAKKRALLDPAKYARFLEGQERRGDKAASSRTRLSDFEQSARELLVDTALDCDVIVGTPVALAKFANHCTQWTPDLIVVDEVGRMTESAALIAMSKYPNAACLFVGDPRQFGPVVVAEGSNVPNSTLFSEQRKQALIARGHFSDRIDITLRENHRCHAGAGRWCRDEYYSRTMSIYHRHSRETFDLLEYLQRFTSKDLETNNLWIEVEDSRECQIGTSFINPVQARFVVELAVQMISKAPLRNMQDVVRAAREPDHRIRKGSVMILTAYAQQKAEYQQLLARLSPAEFPPGMLSVRTIDDSQSQQASLVIIDLVRSENKAGFIDNPTRLAVAMSRAELAHIIVGSASIVKGWRQRDVNLFSRLYDPPMYDLTSLFARLKDENAVVQVESEDDDWDWSRWCNRCLRPGHIQAECTAELKCTACHAALRKSDHAGRYCPSPVAMSPWYDVKAEPIDNVFRDIQFAAEEEEAEGAEELMTPPRRRDRRRRR